MKYISVYSNKKYTNILIGDFNLPKIDRSINCGPTHDVYMLFLTFVLENSYIQMVNFPTCDASVLDLILTDDASLFTVVVPDLPVGTSDHSSIKFQAMLFDNSDSQYSPRDVRYKWHQGDFEAIEMYLQNINWYALICCNPSAFDAWNTFISILYTAVDIFVPCVNYSTGIKRRCRGHYPRVLWSCAARKRHLWHLLKLNPNDCRLRAMYRECAHKWRHLIQQQEISDEEKLISAENVGAFCRFVNKRIYGSVPVIIDSNGTAINESADIASCFNAHFASVGLPSNAYTPHTPQCSMHNVCKLSFVDVCESDVIIAVNKLKGNLSVGPDSLPPFLFKRVKNSVVSYHN